jgi:glycosyltransferase involved in cell wall biosynthesis
MPLDILAIEPYCGGSHRAFLEGLAERSRHNVAILSMPPRKWKWRMRGAPLSFARDLDRPFDVLLTSDFLDLAALVGLRPKRLADVPKAVYFHENQLTYPVRHESERDFQYGFTNISTCLAADRVFFNTAFHRMEFLEAVAALLKRMPDHVPEGIPEAIAERSEVLPLGCDLASLDIAQPPAREGPPVLVWNHRWEYDKNPEMLFSVLFELADEGVDFRLIVAGQSFRAEPIIFDVARRKLAEQTVHFGYAAHRAEYARLLHQADIALSTAEHEFFGIAAVEAMYCNCYPLFPNKLTYPELIPPEHHAAHLYDGAEGLTARLRELLGQPDAVRQVSLRAAAARFDWSELIDRYDTALESLCH